MRRTVVLKITRRGLAWRAALVAAVIVSVCLVGILPWPRRRDATLSKREALDLGPRRSVPGALAALGVGPQRYVPAVFDVLGVGPRRRVPNILPVSLEEGWVSSEFGMRIHPITKKRAMHYGIDLAVDEGVPVKAAADGEVIFSGNSGNYGNLVKIDHGNGIETRYAHNSVLKVKAGDFVRRGQVISLAGHTGRATGDHLHYEVRVNGEAVNPRKSLPTSFVEGGLKRRGK